MQVQPKYNSNFVGVVDYQILGSEGAYHILNSELSVLELLFIYQFLN